MAIPITQLETWSNQGATETPKALRERIESALKGNSSLITNKNSVSIYLQGSYRNSTNIYGNSDVDVVVQTNNMYFDDISALSSTERDLYNAHTSRSSYSWSEYKKEVLDTLVNSFGYNNVEVGNKSIKINTGTYEADVVPCVQYRKYRVYQGNTEDTNTYSEGMKFFTSKENREVINYPKSHYEYGVQKNQQTEKVYKKTVRIFKNMKKTLVSRSVLEKSTAPSYFIENLLYNVPNDHFVKNNLQQTVYNVLLWLGKNNNNMNSFVCQNEMLYLFGNTKEQWNTSDASKFINECTLLWNGWGE
ncbi:nucleotidyltransferase [Psychrobacillus sp. MER TA 171]|uniref:nucleotidyltransferase domain-containing protein n=1 Tax=Psychrobacillus sp. MER TA 171 TaxID=2939577 RepID=UPI00203D4AEF|nr:nucleotidyltransferase [Psychrobacillus sp. MER TA 171]MCM3358123.1 nucleotidyltransferase [Psychrobacillus sp. MER TA 171]